MRVALADIARDEARALEACATDDPPDPRAIRAIGRAVRRAKIEKFTRRTLPRMVCGSAWILLAVYLALTVALAADAGARARLLSWMERAAPLRWAELDPGGAQRDGVPAELAEKYYRRTSRRAGRWRAVDPALETWSTGGRGSLLQFGVYEGTSPPRHPPGRRQDHPRRRARRHGRWRRRIWKRALLGDVAGGGWTIVIYVDADLDTAPQRWPRAFARSARPENDRRRSAHESTFIPWPECFSGHARC